MPILFLFSAMPVQGKEVLERKIDVRFHQTLLKDALVVVAQKGGFEWSYNANIIEGARHVSLIANDWTIREILYALLGEGYQFKSSGNYLIIKKGAASGGQISGYIKDPKTGKRVAGATVYDKRTLRATTTDSNGYYALKVKKHADIVVTKLDFKDTFLQVTPQTPHFVTVDLKPVAVDTLPPTATTTIQEDLEQITNDLNRFFDATLEKWHERNLRDTLSREWQVSVLPGIGTNHTLSSKVTNDWSFNVFAGYSSGTNYLEVAGIGNFTKKKVNGVQVGGVFNQNAGSTYGIQVGGVYNTTMDTLAGIQIGGVVNHAGIANNAIQISGLYNGARHGKLWIQSAGLINLADTINAVQISGLANTVNQMEGIQIAGLINKAQQSTGVQVSGLLNHAQEIEGVQFGPINRAKKMSGLQFGLINTADDCDCTQIGLLNRSGKKWRPLLFVHRPAAPHSL